MNCSCSLEFTTSWFSISRQFYRESFALVPKYLHGSITVSIAIKVTDKIKRTGGKQCVRVVREIFKHLYLDRSNDEEHG